MTSMISRFTIPMLSVILISIATVSPKADEASDIKYRQTIMKAIGGTMGSMAAIVKGKAPQAHAAPLAQAMLQLSSTVKDVFPNGSDFGETRAKAEIWQKPTEFKAAVAAFETAALTISKVSQSGDPAAFVNAFKALGKSCGGCHKPFRQPKK